MRFLGVVYAKQRVRPALTTDCCDNAVMLFSNLVLFHLTGWPIGIVVMLRTGFGSNSFEKDNNFVRSVERFSNTYKRQFHQLLLFFYKTTVAFSTFLFFLDNLSTSSHSCHYLDCLNSYHEVECIPALLRCAEAILHGYSSSCFLSFCLLRCHHNHLLYHQYSFSTGYP